MTGGPPGHRGQLPGCRDAAVRPTSGRGSGAGRPRDRTRGAHGTRGWGARVWSGPRGGPHRSALGQQDRNHLSKATGAHAGEHEKRGETAGAAQEAASSFHRQTGGGGSQGGSECGVQPRATCRLCSGSQRATDGKQQQKEETHPGQLSVPRGSCCCFQRHDVVTAKGLQKALTFSRGTWEHPPVRGQTSRRPPNHLRGEREDDTRIGRPRKQEAGPGSPPPLRPPPCREAETPCHGA